ncbi:MAG: heparan N-sulfatase, partial [Planctomycetes bacterium]|nr:heparan N-sulfatase [Planctomycetota bacterium]
GSTVKAFVSMTDLAPTFLTAAGVEVPDVMTGRSLLGLTEGSNGTDLDGRDFVVFGRERHTPAQALPSLEGYPARAIRTDRWLLIVNLEPERWPAGVPSGATHPMDVHADCDNGPTKRLLVQGREDPRFAKFYALCFAKRPRVELYDCAADPDQVRNLALAEEHAKTVTRLRSRLDAYLRETGDPRMKAGSCDFDSYPYRAGKIDERIETWRERRKK